MFMRKWKWFVLILILLYFGNCITETIPLNLDLTPKNDSKLTVLCYNVHGSDPNYKENQVGIADLILEESPDVAFLCEYSLSKSKILDSLLMCNAYYQRYYKSGTNCVFYSKYPIDSIVGVYTNSKRSLTNKVNLIKDKDTITIVGCHLSSSRKDFLQGVKCRAVEVDSIYNFIRQEKQAKGEISVNPPSVENHPIIVMGDLNDVSGSYTINRIKDAGLSDAWWEGGCGYGTTFHDGWLHLRIDHILFQSSKLRLNTIKVIESDLSDHNALVAGFSFR